jgi:hypothetical protein
MIQEAYGIYEEDRLSGGPMWLPTQKFDIHNGGLKVQEFSMPALALSLFRVFGPHCR